MVSGRFRLTNKMKKTIGFIKETIIVQLRNSRLAKILLLIVFLKFLIFYGFLKGFLYPRYLKPKYESEQQRSEQVIEHITQSGK